MKYFHHVTKQSHHVMIVIENVQVQHQSYHNSLLYIVLSSYTIFLFLITATTSSSVKLDIIIKKPCGNDKHIFLGKHEGNGTKTHISVLRVTRLQTEGYKYGANHFVQCQRTREQNSCSSWFADLRHLNFFSIYLTDQQHFSSALIGSSNTKYPVLTTSVTHQSKKWLPAHFFLVSEKEILKINEEGPL